MAAVDQKSNEEPPKVSRQTTAHFTNAINSFLPTDETNEQETEALNEVMHERKAEYGELLHKEFHNNSVPASTMVKESGVVKANVQDVWNLVKNVNFSWREGATVDGDVDSMVLDSLRTVNYGDCVQTVAVRGVNGYDHEVIYELVSSEPAVPYSAALYNIKLHPITISGETLVVFTTNFSNDATSSVVQDQIFKLKDSIATLQKLVTPAEEAEN